MTRCRVLLNAVKRTIVAGSREQGVEPNAMSGFIARLGRFVRPSSFRTRFRPAMSNQPTRSHRGGVAGADDQVIEHADTDQGQGLAQLAGDGTVGGAGLGHA